MAPTDVLATARAALAAGLCTVPVETTGKKKPRNVKGKGALRKDGTRGSGWKAYCEQMPTPDEIEAWFGDGHPGIGYVCGAVSGNLIMLELEGRAVEEGVGKKLVKLARESGRFELLKRLANGYSEETPSGGIHYLYRLLEGDVPGNVKLARRAATEAELAEKPDDKIKVLIETRGEGGFTVAAPSHGTVHPSGKPWKMLGGSVATIPVLTWAEHESLMALCAELDELPEAATPPPPPPPEERLSLKCYTGDVGDSWRDAVEAHLNGTTTMQALLERYSFTEDHRVQGYVYMARPGVDHPSVSINGSDRITVFSTALPFVAWDGKTKPAPTYSKMDVLTVYEHGGDRDAAMKFIGEQTGILAAWQERRRREDEALFSGWANAGKAAADELDDGTDSGPADDEPAVDEETGELTGGTAETDGTDSPTNLPTQFYDARARLAHIRQAAYSRSRSADAVLAATFARVAVQVPPTIVLPAIVGSVATLDVIIANTAKPGGGKSSAVGVAKEIMPIDDDAIVLDFPLGSGEGLVDAYLGSVDDLDAAGKKVKVRRQVFRAVLAEVDEGEVLSGMGHRKGSTIFPTLRSAWSGSMLGQGNASAETKRRLNARSYRFAATIALQPAHAIALLDDAPGGTPQRVLWFSAEDPNLPDDEPPWPGRLTFEVPMASHFGLPYTMKVDDAIADEVRARSKAKTRGTAIGADPLDSHADLLRLKVAALLAILDDRLDVNRDDWSLAGLVMATSRAVRTSVVETARIDARQREDAATAKAIRREVAIVGTVEARALTNAARAVGKRAHRSKGDTIPRSKFTTAIASRDRGMVTVDDAIAEAERLGWVIATADGWTAGKARPS